MNTRERVRAILNFEPVDRLPVVEWAPWWDQTLQRWHSEKLPAALTDRFEICRHFGLDMLKYLHYGPMGRNFPRSSVHGQGVVASHDDYTRVLPHLYGPVVDGNLWSAWGKEQASGDAALWFNIDGFFWFPRTLFGIEPHLYAFYDQADLMHRINADLAAWQIRVFDEICKHAVPEFVCFAEDMSYNHGPMLSQEQFDTFLRPYYERVVPHIKARGCKVFVDTDGDVTLAMDWFAKAGIEGFLPLERQAGVDVAALRRQHPTMKFLGAFDKMTMNRGEAAMRAEFERLLPVASGGGFIIGCDHQTPPGVSYDDYALYVRLFKEYAVKAAQTPALRAPIRQP
jgi:hypothetical protein